MLISLVLVILVEAGLIAFLEFHHRQVEADLLDRIMARNFQEYQVITARQKRPLKTFSTDDRTMAEMEAKKQLTEEEALLVARG